MFCSNCGNEITSGSNFCPKCGQSIHRNDFATRSISMKCSKCDGDMMVDKEQNILFCPYCDSKEEIPESDVIKLTRMQAEIQREVEQKKHDHEMEKKRLEIEQNEKSRKRLIRIRLIGGILMTLSVFLFFFSLVNVDRISDTAGMIMLILTQPLMIVGIVFLAQKRRS